MSAEIENKTQTQGDLKKQQQKIKRYLMWVLLLLLCLLVGYCSFNTFNKNKNAVTPPPAPATGVALPKESTLETAFNLAEVTAVGAAALQSSSYITTESEFVRVMEENIAIARQSNSKEVAVPAIAVFFKKGSPYVTPQNRSFIATFAKYYNQTNQNATVLVEGYACDLGSLALNRNMSKMRTQKAALFLTNNATPDDKIQQEWYGETKVDEKLFDSRKEYRRVNISIK